MFAKMTRSSSLVDSSRQLFKFPMTSSSVNCDEQGPSFGPREHLQPLSRNLFTLSTIPSAFAFSVNSIACSSFSIFDVRVTACLMIVRI